MPMTPDDYSRILRDHGCFDFLREPAQAAVAEILLACPEAERLLSDGAKSDLEKTFCSRMEVLYLHPLLEKLKEIDPSITFASSSDTPKLLENAAKKLCARHGFSTEQALSDEFPLIREYAPRIRKNYIDSQAEMLRNLSKYESALSDRIFGGQPLGRIRSLSGDLGDLHRHGRSVRRIVTDAGAVYYKPHDCRFEALYKGLVTSLFSDCTLCPEVICGDGVGFEEELKPGDLESLSQASVYFYNFGMLVALFHAIGSTDMHCENIMACGTLPVAIDLETLVRGRISRSIKGGPVRQAPLSPIEKDFMHTVAEIGFLPVNVIKNVTVSALHLSSAEVNSLPVWQGRKLEVTGCEEDLLRGFRSGYDRILAHREELRAFVQEGADLPFRYVAKNTSYYYYLKSRLFQSGAMADTTGRDAVLDRLEVPYTSRNMPVMREVVDYEASCLLEGDIPYFCSAVGGHALCGQNTDQVLYEGYWDMSAAERAQDRMDMLSEAEREYEVSYMRAALDHAPLAEPDPVECPALPGQELAAEETRALCGNLLKEVEEDSFRVPSGGRVWHSGSLAIEKTPGCGFITQYADVVLFCGTVLSEPTLAAYHEKALQIAEPCLAAMHEFAARLEVESGDYMRAALSLGLESGLGGVLLAAAAAARAGIKGSGDLADRFLQLICRNRLYQDALIPGGEAGLVLAVSALSGAAPPASPAAQVMTGCGEVLLSRSAFESPLQEALKGAALSEVFRVSGEDRFAQAANEAFQRVRDAYLPIIPGWAKGKAAIAWLADSGGQEGGIALCATIAAEVLTCDVCAEVRDLALDTLAKKQTLARSDSLYDGNALSALALIRSAGLPGREKDLSLAGRLLSGMVKRREARGCFTCSPPGIRSYFDVSVCRGTLGPGYTAAAYLKTIREKASSRPKDL